jgi:hypothetical protein
MITGYLSEHLSKLRTQHSRQLPILHMKWVSYRPRITTHITQTKVSATLKEHEELMEDWASVTRQISIHSGTLRVGVQALRLKNFYSF